MKNLLFALALFGVTSIYHANAQENSVRMASGTSLVCYTQEAADAIANATTTQEAQRAADQQTATRSCIVAEFRGEELRAYRQFVVAGYQYTWMIVDFQAAGQAYVLRPDGPVV